MNIPEIEVRISGSGLVARVQWGRDPSSGEPELYALTFEKGNEDNDPIESFTEDEWDAMHARVKKAFAALTGDLG